MIPAAAYLRRSTTKQELSLEGQREEIEKYARANQYQVVRWYTDDGISGATGEERPQFQQMLRDADEKRDFNVLICYDLSRFGRMDADETGHCRHLLRRAGVRVCLSNEQDGGDGPNSELVRSVLQTQKRELLRQISRDTARGMAQSVRDGWITGRAAAFGLDRMLVNEKGEQCRRLKRGESVEKPRNWHVTLIPSDDAREVEALRWIFEEYVRSEIGCAAIAAKLNERGIASPHGGLWQTVTVRSIITNPVYKGDIVFGRKSEGRFHRIVNGEVREVGPAEQKVVRRPLEACVVTHRPEIALIPAELWQAANRKLKARGNRQVGARARPRAYVLSGLVRCSECKAPMVGVPRHDKTGRTQLYSCSSHFRYRRCNRNSVVEERLLRVLYDMLMERLFCGGDLERLRAVILDRLEERLDSGRERTMRSELATAKTALERATKNVLMVDPANVPLLNAEMTTLRNRVKVLEDELASVRKRDDPKAIADRLVAQVRAMIHDLHNGNRDRLKAIFGELVEKVELGFKPTTLGRRTVRRVASCDVYVRDVLTTHGRGGGI